MVAQNALRFKCTDTHFLDSYYVFDSVNEIASIYYWQLYVLWPLAYDDVQVRFPSSIPEHYVTVLSTCRYILSRGSAYNEIIFGGETDATTTDEQGHIDRHYFRGCPSVTLRRSNNPIAFLYVVI